MDDSRIANADDLRSLVDSDRDPIEELAAEFIERRRKGERTCVDEYVQRYPQHAEEIRALFPTIAAMEGLHRHIEQDLSTSWTAAQPQIERLGDFRVIGEIGRGGMGVVYEAEQESLGRRVAVKVLNRPAIYDEKDVRRFQREAKTAARLHHSNIVQVFGVGEQDGHHYIVMELIHGVGLDEILDEIHRLSLAAGDGASAKRRSHTDEKDSPRRRSSRLSAVALLQGATQPESIATSTSESGLIESLVADSSATTSTCLTSANGDPAALRIADGNDASLDPVPEMPTNPFELGRAYWRNVARLGVQVANAVQYAHSRGTLHRDIKPGNLLLDQDGNVRVVDFGLALAAEHANLTWTGDVVGTISYLAPERFHGQADARSDIYSIGLTLYEMLTLRRAFDDTDRAALVRRICNEEVLPPRKVNPNVPRDLDTIVQKAISGRPADRYQSAGDLADDLVRVLEDRPIRARRTSGVERTIRWVRRNPAIAGLTAAVAALIVVAASLAAVGYSKQAAERMRAQETARIAVEALDNIYDQFSPEAIQLPSQASLDATEIEAIDDDLLLESESPPLSKDVALILENLLEFYDRLSHQTTDNATVVGQSILASRRVGDIRYRLGDISKAETAYRQAIARSENAGGTVTRNPSFPIELGRIYNGLGITLEDQDAPTPAQARAAHQKALAILQSAASNLARDFELARTFYLLHVVENKRRWGEEEEETEDWTPHNYVEQAVSIINERTAEQSNLPQFQFLLARCYRAPMARRLRDSAWDRHAAQEKAVGILERLVEQYPEVADFRFELAEAYSSGEFRRLFHRRNRDQAPDPAALRLAEEKVRRSLDVTDNFEHTHPNIPEYLSARVGFHHLLAKILRDMGRVEESIVQLQKALEVHKSMIGISASPIRSRLFQARIQLRLAADFQDIGQVERSRTTLQDAIADLNALANQVEGRDRSRLEHMQREAAEALRNLGPEEVT